VIWPVASSCSLKASSHGLAQTWAQPTHLAVSQAGSTASLQQVIALEVQIHEVHLGRYCSMYCDGVHLQLVMCQFPVELLVVLAQAKGKAALPAA